jgi:SAM-dependent methyltransferase
LTTVGLDFQNARVLDVGCANGYGLRPFLNAGFRVEQLTGVDLPERQARLDDGMRMIPGLNLVACDGTDMTPVFSDSSFDLVCEQFCFCHIPEMPVKQAIAREMLRVTKPEGFLIIHDWRMTFPPKNIYGPSFSTIRELFPNTELVGRWASQIWSPIIGHRLSQWAPPLYHALRLVPPLVGSWLTVLRKPKA